MGIKPSFNASKRSFSNRNKGYNTSENHGDSENRFFEFCYYLGGYTQLYTKRAFRYLKRIFTPAADFCSLVFEKAVTNRWMKLKDEWSDVKADFGTVSKRYKSAEGFKGKSIETFKIAVDGVTKHHSITVKLLNIIAPLLALLILFLTINHYANLDYALEVSYNGERLGFIENEGVYTSAADMINERIVSSNASAALENIPTFSLTVADSDTNFKSDNDICDNLLGASVGELEEAYGLSVNGEFIGAIRSEGDMSFILDSYLKSFSVGNINETIEFVDLVKVTYGYYPVSGIISSEEFRDKLSQVTNATEYYTVQSGDTAYGICRKYGMQLSDLNALNENLEELLHPNRRIKVTVERPTLQVRTLTTKTYTEYIAYSTKTVKDSTKYTDYKKLQTAGVKGLQKVTEQQVYIDGILTEKVVTERVVQKEPVDEVYVVGTKQRKPQNNTGGNNGNTTIKSTGRFTWPVPGYTKISSYYGKRWGKMHKGIDISSHGIYGASIVAADSGTVTVATSSSGGYGKYVIIDHGNGYSTLYGHCSKLLVKKGQKVSKGQVIAKVGSTGHSTGPHLHFEIRKNGTANNPLNYF